MELKITPSGQTIVKPSALGPVANTDTKLLIYGLFQKGRVLAQDGIDFLRSTALVLRACGNGSRPLSNRFRNRPVNPPPLITDAHDELGLSR